MAVTYVTALYDIYGSPEKKSFNLKHFRQLEALRAPLVVFCDESYFPEVRERSCDGRQVILLPLEQVRAFSLCTGRAASGAPPELPKVRTPQKDTLEYLALMNSKVEFVRRAAELTDSEYLCWIDAAFAKLMSDPDRALKFLERFRPKVDRVLLPGCWGRMPVSTEAVCWRFAGTFFVVPRQRARAFEEICLPTFEDMSHGRRPSVWEVNVWAEVENKFPEMFQWYAGDHNDKLFDVPKEFLAEAL
ncbi:MAG: hypothetical protein ACYCOU_03455 [Sulfobacillus sp.]